MWLALPLGLAVGLALGGLGGGGSVLAVPALVYVLHETPTQATTASLIIVAATSTAAAVDHARAGHVRWRAGFGFAASGLVAAAAGSWASKGLDPQVLLIGFGGLMLVAAGAMWRASTHEPAADNTPEAGPGHGVPGAVAVLAPPQVTPRTRLVRTVAAGAVVGLLTGVFGVGGGFLAVPALVYAAGFTMPAAVGTSLVVIAVNSAAALATRVGTTTIAWHVVIPFAVAGVAGALVGKRAADHVSSRALQRAFALMLIALAVFVVSDQLRHG